MGGYLNKTIIHWNENYNTIFSQKRITRSNRDKYYTIFIAYISLLHLFYENQPHYLVTIEI